MKRFLAVVVVALTAVGVYAAVAPAGPQAVTPGQFAALSKKVAAQGKTINNLKKELSAVETCALAHAQAVAQYGNPPGNEGYVYNNPDNSLELQTALDAAPAADAQAWVLVTTSTCANVINGGKKAPTSLRPHMK